MNLFAVQPHMRTVSGRKVPPAFIEQAEKHRQRGELDKALETCEHLVRECPGYVSGHIALARTRLELKDTDGAQEALNAAISLDPMNPVANNLLARLDLDNGLRERATRRLEDVLFFYPNDPEAAALLRAASRTETRQPAPEPAAPLLQPTQTPAEVAQAELETLRTAPDVTGAMVVDGQGRPLWGSLGRGEQTDGSTAAKVAASVQVWTQSWAQASNPVRAIVESPGGRLVVVPCGEWVLVVGLSLRIRAGRVLGAIDQAAERLRAANVTAQHERHPV